MIVTAIGRGPAVFVQLTTKSGLFAVFFVVFMMGLVMMLGFAFASRLGGRGDHRRAGERRQSEDNYEFFHVF
jgi:hypothetical protein